MFFHPFCHAVSAPPLVTGNHPSVSESTLHTLPHSAQRCKLAKCILQCSVNLYLYIVFINVLQDVLYFDIYVYIYIYISVGYIFSYININIYNIYT